MDVLLVIVIWLTFCFAIIYPIRKGLVIFSRHKGYAEEDIPLKYHIYAIGTYFTLIYPALFVLNQIF